MESNVHTHDSTAFNIVSIPAIHTPGPSVQYVTFISEDNVALYYPLDSYTNNLESQTSSVSLSTFSSVESNQSNETTIKSGALEIEGMTNYKREDQDEVLSLSSNSDSSVEPLPFLDENKNKIYCSLCKTTTNFQKDHTKEKFLDFTFDMTNFLNDIKLSQLARFWIEEFLDSEINYNDLLFNNQQILLTANIFNCNQTCIFAGHQFVEIVMKELSKLHIYKFTIEWHFSDGTQLLPKSKVATISGTVKCFSLIENILLPVLGRCCAVATDANRIKRTLRANNWTGEVFGTANDHTPGFELVEQYGQMVGTGCLQSQGFVLLSAKAIAQMTGQKKMSRIDYIKKKIECFKFQTKFKIECETNEEALVIAESGLVNVIVLKPVYQHNPLDELLAILYLAQRIKVINSNILIELYVKDGRELLTHLSTLKIVPHEIDIISIRSLFKSYRPIDFSLRYIES